MAFLLSKESYESKLAKQRLAQQRHASRQLEKQQARLNDSSYIEAEKAKQYAAKKRQVERQQTKLKEKLNNPNFFKEQKIAQQKALKKQQLKASTKALKQSPKTKSPTTTQIREAHAKYSTLKKATKPIASKGLKGRNRTAEEKRLESKLADIGCICCLNKGWYTSAMQSTEGQRFISMHHIEGRVKPWAHAKQLPLCHFHHQTPPPKEAPEDLFPIHGGAIPVWEKVNGSQQSLLKQAYEIIKEEFPWNELPLMAS